MRPPGVGTEGLPDDPAVLRALLAGALSRCAALEAERTALEAQNERLRHLSRRLVFSRS